MRIEHTGSVTTLTGKPSEKAALLAWVERAKQIEPNLVIGADDCDEYEASFTVVAQYTTQAERQQAFSSTKKI